MSQVTHLRELRVVMGQCKVIAPANGTRLISRAQQAVEGRVNSRKPIPKVTALPWDSAPCALITFSSAIAASGERSQKLEMPLRSTKST